PLGPRASLNHRLPLSPEAARGQLVVRARLAPHAARHVGPRELVSAESDLAGFQRLDIVGWAEAAGSLERQAAFKPILGEALALVTRHQLPLADLHHVGGERPRLRQLEAGLGVVEREVREDNQEARVIGHAVTASFAVALRELAAQLDG